ncbi:hypothetical protein D3C77_306410 [compost metagenome]
MDEEWEAEFDPTYDAKTEEGGVWYGLDDEAIVLLQIEDFKDGEHEEYHRRLDELEANELED